MIIILAIALLVASLAANAKEGRERGDNLGRRNL